MLYEMGFFLIVF